MAYFTIDLSAWPWTDSTEGTNEIMPNSEEISSKEALEMIIRGQIGELLFRRVKVDPDWVDIHNSEVTRAADLGVELIVNVCGSVASKWVPCNGIVRSVNARYRANRNTFPEGFSVAAVAREEPVFEAAPNMTVSVTTGPVTVGTENGEPMAIENASIINVKLAPGESVRAGQCVTAGDLEKFGVSVRWGPGTVIDEKPASLLDKVGARVSEVVTGGMHAAEVKDWLFALIDVLDDVVSVKPVKQLESIRQMIGKKLLLKGGISMIPSINLSDRLESLIDVLDEERAQSGQSRPVGKDRGIE